LWRADGLLPPADITIATHFSTAAAVRLYGSGARAQFLQHDEALVASAEGERLAALEASLVEHMPLARIANSSWLCGRIEQKTGSLPALAFNAIDHRVFCPRPRVRTNEAFTVMSYSGRGLPWKGFESAAVAIRNVRKVIPDLRWVTFGGPASLPPDNGVASYEPLGFMHGETLARSYAQADVVLCPAWYESFPLYPLEAMACSVPVVTTPAGTEDYARDGQTALVVEPKAPEGMASAILRLATDHELRRTIGLNGYAEANTFTWPRASAMMEAALLKIAAA
jgi:glycosyltransferase involved in cell wall biosynthesis